jgi:hypothetical protein
MKQLYELPTTYIQCSCYSELLQLVYDNEDEQKFLYVSMYKDWHNKPSWLRRLQHIWYIIKYGFPWADQITLNQNEIEKLKNYLNKL